LSPVSKSPTETARRQFLRTFLHDLATPLSAVSLHLEGANRRIARGEDPGESLNTARSELGRAFELFEHGRELLLSESRDVESFDFDEWVASTVGAFSGDGVEVRGATGARISADRKRLTQALTSLVANALEYGAPRDVVVFCERAEGGLRVRIENSGKLPAEDPDKLFAPRATSPGKNWGMGLSLARLYAADAGGVVRLSQAGDRVSATLSFPEERA
jgi:signal transduction histidine kinase